MQDKGLERFPGAENREPGGPEQGSSDAEQGSEAAHGRAPSGVNPDAACHAIVAISAAFAPAAEIF
jgi:hypothetical protein